MKTHLLIKSVCVSAGFSLLLALPAYAVRSDADSRPGIPAPQAAPKAAAVRAPAAEQVEAANLAEAAGVKTEWHSRLGTPRSIRGPGLGQRRSYSGGKGLAVGGGGRYEEDAIAVMDNLSRLYRVQDAKAEFSAKRVEKDSLDFHHVRLAQVHRGLPVVGGDVLVHFDRSGEAYQVNGQYIPDIQVEIVPRISADEAAQAAQRDLAALDKPAGTLEAEPALVVFARNVEPMLAYELTLLTDDPKAGPGRWRYWIDAGSGKVLLRYDDIKKVAPPTANGAPASVTGNILAGEGGQWVGFTGWRENTGYYYLYNTNRHWLVFNLATSGYPDNNTYAYRTTSDWGASDRAEVSAARNFDIVQRFYTEVLGLNSFNNAGLYAQANVHEGTSYVNAYWDGSDFHFGDGDGVEANSLAILDVCGHEYTHAVTDYSAGLIYAYESGALNESFSDILGGCVEFYAEPDGRALYPTKSPGTADWLCAEDCWLSSVALRDMRNPGNTATVGAGNEQPSRYRGTHWYAGAGDNGGVHYNSGVQNFFFYLLSEGGSGNNDGIIYTVAGIGITNAGQVAFRALTVYCTPNTDYELARSAWMSAAMDLNTNWAGSVGEAWSAVGIGALQAAPDGIAFRGPVGGPFSPPTQTCALLNRGALPMDWSVTYSQTWLTVSPTNGTIPAYGSNLLTLSIVAAGGALPAGIYTNNLIFTNSVETTILSQPVKLLVGQPDYFTELFEANDNDLDFQTLTFTPDGSSSHYALCREPATSFPTDPAGGASVVLSDDSYAQVTLAGASTVAIYGRRTNVFFIGSNGYLTMDSGDGNFSESLATHFELPRIAACFDDLNPGTGGTVSYKQISDRAAVTFSNVREYGSSATASFQIEMFYDGRIRITYLAMGVTDGLAGLSAGMGLSAGFMESDLTGYSVCAPPDDLVATPSTGLIAQGYEGGPFTPSSATYTLTNVGATEVNWSAAVTQPWVTLGAAGGNLAPGASTSVAVAINSSALSLGVGDYAALVTFSNLASGFVHSRAVVLHVAPIPGEIVVLDSFPPATDLQMPFGEVMLGSARAGQITVTNSDPTYSLIISNISLRGGMYMEDFNDGQAQGWIPDLAASWQVVGGEYRAQTSVGDFMTSRYGEQQWSDLTAQMSCRRTASPSSSAAVVLRATADFDETVGSGYVFQIATDGSYGIWKQVNGAWSWLQAWASSPAIGAGTNVLTAVAEGSALRFYINGTLVWSGTDTALAGGRIGLMGYSDSADPTTHYFDNVIVSGPVGGGALSAQQQWLNEQAVAGSDRAVAPQVARPDYVDRPEPPLPGETALTFLSRTNGAWRLDNLPTLPFSLPAGGGLVLDVTYAPTTVGSNDAKVIIESNDANEPAVEVQMTGFGLPDHLRVTPATGLVSQGPPGGPFSPGSASYVLSNAGPSALSWTARNSQNWVNVTPADGTLPVGQSASVIVALTALANSLPGGQYADSVVFSNQNTAAVQRRTVALTAQVPPPALAQALDTPGWTWVTGGTMPWIGQTTNTHDGVDAGQSGVISHNQESWMETSVAGPGAVTFWWSVSSETGYDYVQFQINGIVFRQISGAAGWNWVSNRLAGGTQTLRWRYMKDGSVNSGQDKGWVDQVSFVPDAPCPRIISQPANTTVTLGGTATFDVVASGSSPLYYHWRKNAVPLDGATNASLTLANVQTNDAGAYSVLITNFCGSALSSNAVLTVTDDDESCLDFQITGLFDSNSRVVDHNVLTGDDRGGIALSRSRVFVTGDSATARFEAADLTGGAGLGSTVDGLCTDLRTEAVYTLGNGSVPLTRSGGNATSLIELNGATGQPTGVVVPLSQWFNMPSFGNGIFSGYGRVVVHNGTRVYDILLPSGTVIDRGPMTRPNWNYSESWSVWGVAEYFGGALYLSYARNAYPVTTIQRARVPTGVLGTVAAFSNLADLASFTVSLSRNRWYFHYEGNGQFGGMYETLGYADAQFSFCTTDPPWIVSQPASQTIRPGTNVSFCVTAVGAQTYRWRKDGTNLVEGGRIIGATDACLTILNVVEGDSGLYSVAITNANGGVISSNATLWVTPVHHFTWSPIPSPQRDDVPFTALIFARDYLNHQVPFNGCVTLSSSALLTNTVGTGTSTANFPMGTFYHDERTQVIYRPAEVGGAGRITVLSLNVAARPGQIMNAWTIRMKHTPLAGYTNYLWEGSDWTVVYRTNLSVTVTAAGWVSFPFMTPFEYNGVDSLIVDFSFNNSSYTTDGLCRVTARAGARTLYYRTDSGYGDPLTWLGDSPTPTVSSLTPNLRLTMEATSTVPVQPAVACFTNGVWPGRVTVQAPATNLVLRADSVMGLFGLSNPFNVLPSPPIILAQPASQTVVVGDAATFCVTAAGTDPLGYFWSRNGIPISGATASCHTITNVPFSESGARFSCLVSNAYGTASSAAAVLTVDRPPIADASATRPMLVSANGLNATAVLDGSRSSDPDGDPLRYLWFETGATNELATGVVAVVTLPLGTNWLELVVSDGWAASTDPCCVEVLTTAQATERLALAVTGGVDRNQPLIASLSATLAAIDRSNPTAAMNQLQAFQSQVRAQITPLDPVLADQFIRLAQEIIEILSADSKARGKVAALGLQTNGSLRLQFSAPPGPIYIVEASTDLANWDKIGVATDAGNGVFVFEDANAPRMTTRFYRIVLP